MNRTMNTVSVAAFAALLFGVLGCADLVGDLRQGRDQAVRAQHESESVVSILEAEAEKLPEGDPVRVVVEKKLVQVREVLEQAKHYIAVADTALDSAGRGEVAPELTAVLNTVPFGVYIGSALSLVFALGRHFKAQKLDTALRKVVQSWDEAGEELTAPEKRAVRLIQGDDVTKVVHEIRSDLAAR